MPRYRAITNAAPIRPKIAPLAPTVTSVWVRRQQRAERAGQQRHEVDGDEAERSDRGLDQRAEDVEGEHVQQQVEGAGVQECAVTIRTHRPRDLRAGAP